MSSSLNVEISIVDPEVCEYGCEHAAISLRGIVRFTPVRGLEQLCFGWLESLEICEVLAGALVDRCVELEMNLVEP